MTGSAPPLLAAPNVSEGRDDASVEAIATAFTAGGGARLLDVHSDGDHHRAVITLAGCPGSLAEALAAGAAEAVGRVEIGNGGGECQAGGDLGRPGYSHVGGESGRPGYSHVGGESGRLGYSHIGGESGRRGEHPYVGAVDVVPVVYLDPAQRGAACAEALVAAQLIGGQLGVPVFLYGELADGRTRAQLRRGGVNGLSERMRAGELSPDFGPSAMHPTAGATLVAARGPLVAFNLELTPPNTVEDAQRIAGMIREGGAEGIPGVRAIGVALRRGPAGGAHRDGGGGGGPAGGAHRDGGRGGGSAERTVAQVSMNVERPAQTPLRTVVEAVRRHAQVACAELVGLAPAAALEGFPEDVPIPGFDPARHVIENALG